MWRLSNAQAVIFVALVVIMVAPHRVVFEVRTEIAKVCLEMGRQERPLEQQ